METTIYSIHSAHDTNNIVWESPLTDKEKEQLNVAADPSIVEVLPTGEIYVTQLEYRKKLNEVFGAGNWRLVPCSPWFEDVNCRRQMWALEVRGKILSYAWGEDETYRMKEGDEKKNSPSFAAPEIAKSNALMRLTKDLLLFSNLWDKTFIKSFLNNYCEKVSIYNSRSGKMDDQWKKKGETFNNNYNNSEMKNAPTSNPFLPNTPLVGTLLSFSAPGTNNKKSGSALLEIGEQKLETTFFNVPQGASSFEEIQKYVGKKITFTYKQNGRWCNLLSVQYGNVSEIGILRREIEGLLIKKATKLNVDMVALLQRWGKTTVEDIATSDEASHIVYELEQM